MNKTKHTRGLLVIAMALTTTLIMAAPTFAQRQTPPTPVAPATPRAEFSAEDRRTLEGDQTVSGGSFTLEADETLQGDLNIIGGTAETRAGSRIEGGVNVAGGTVEIAGTVTGDVNVVGGTVHLLKGAVVEGKLITLGGTVKKDIGAVTHQGTTQFNGPLPDLDRIFGSGTSEGSPAANGGRWPNFRINSDIDWFDRWNGNIFVELSGIILATLLAIMVISLIPKNIARTISTARSQLGMATAVGGLGYIAVTMAMLLMAITLCLIPGAILLALAWCVGVFVGWTCVAKMLGEWFMRGFGKQDWTVVGQTAVGAGVLALLGSLGVLGVLIGFLASSWGLGALILTRFGTQPYPPTGLQVYTPPMPNSQGPVSL